MPVCKPVWTAVFTSLLSLLERKLKSHQWPLLCPVNKCTNSYGQGCHPEVVCIYCQMLQLKGKVFLHVDIITTLTDTCQYLRPPTLPAELASLDMKRWWLEFVWSQPGYWKPPHTSQQGPAQFFCKEPGTKDSQLCHLYGLLLMQPLSILLV